jgi:hypothetical protein
MGAPKDDKRKRIALRLLGHPSVVWPGVGALGSMLLWGLLGVGGALMAFAGLVLGLVAAGAVSYRFLFKLEDISEEILESIKAEGEAEHNARMQARRARLASDVDLRDEAIFDELRELERAFKEDKSWTENVSPAMVVQVLRRFEDSRESCLQILDRAFDLRATAGRLRGEARQELMRANDELLEQVREAIDGLSKIYAGVQKLSIKRMTGKSAAEAELKENVDELNQLLDVAETAENRREEMFASAEDKYREYLSDGDD